MTPTQNKETTMRTHIVIPDTQCSPGDSFAHLLAAGKLIADIQPDVIVHIGDHWDMGALSSFEKPGSAYFEGKRYWKDIEAGVLGMSALLNPLYNLQRKQRTNREKMYKPQMEFFMGNHEMRIERAVSKDPVLLEGMIGLDDITRTLIKTQWNINDFLVPKVIDGVAYAHYFINPFSIMGAVVAGTIETKLKNLGMSFTMGHQQQLQYGIVNTVTGQPRQGLVAGAFYMGDEDYRNAQGNRTHFRGLIVKRFYAPGRYDPEFWSIDRLLEVYGG